MTKISNQYSLTNILTADLANSRLGINNVSPTVALDVTGAGKFSSSVTATSGSTLFKEGYIIQATTTSGGGSQPAYTYYTAAGSKRWSHFLDVGSDKFNIANASNAEIFTITQAGNVGIGTTSPDSKLNVVGGRSTFYANSESFAINVKYNSAAARGYWIGSPESGIISFSNADGTERLRITDAGNVGIGTTSAGSYYSNKLVVSAAGEDGITIAATTTTTRNFLAFADGTTGEDRYRGLLGYSHTDDNMLFYTNATTKMTISSNGSIGAPSGTNIYNASDVRLKKNISTTTYGLDAISALNPVKFNWVDGFEPSENGKDMLGFIAQEVQSILPEAIESFGGNSVTIGDTIIDNPLRVNEKFIIPVLVKAIQELKAEIETLKNK